MSIDSEWKTMPTEVVLLNSITDAGTDAVGKIGVSGSHGGLFAAAVASRAGLRAVALNDAGIGLDQAGIAGLIALDQVGMAGIAVTANSAEIGSAQDSLDNGIVGFVNETAQRLGVRPGLPLIDQIHLLANASEPSSRLAEVAETRQSVQINKTQVLCVDSASMITPDDAGSIIVTGSHGGLIGGDPARACKANAGFVAFNDASGGKNDMGFTRLPALAARGIAAVTLRHDSCKIGDAQSALATGIISRSNAAAQNLGFLPDQSLLSSFTTR